MPTSLKERLRSQSLSIGMQSFSGSPALVEILGLAGFDWVSLDMEHSPTGLETIEHLARAARAGGTCPLVRVPRNDPIEIMRALDRGVDGVIVPHISSAADLEAAVAATRYHPAGIRGACTSTRASGYGTERWTDYLERAARDLVVVAIIEDEDGVRNFDDLLKVDGADVLWLGTRDLSQAMGLPDTDLHHPDLARLAKDMCDRAAARGKLMMATVGPVLSIEYAQYLHGLGFQCISYGTDVKNFGRFARSVVSGLRPA
ncbi:aldolase/citrate lyase family protein [Dactylosporangium sp. AC04546]|uniref:HpcH/HpaI aldolase family protein n=1 Tax=Dactylosporangium sp. AC04546 TaxID=2862460 RepID=UPI001EDED98F|nr:aldolase/citrate lyase family protein [Dactylosporangium sp. AC04546]WVK79533.1 aldolase/citrate lyase family protein [Dactylosporangium sp. AC04546]